MNIHKLLPKLLTSNKMISVKKLKSVEPRRLGVGMILSVLIATTIFSLFADVVQAAITLRDSNTGSATNDPIALVGTNTTNNGGGSGTMSLAMPTGTVEGHVMLAALTIRGGSGVSITTVPTGWTMLSIKQNAG